MSGVGFLSQHPVLFITSAPLSSYMIRRPHHIFKRLSGLTRTINISWTRGNSGEGIFRRWPGERVGWIRSANRALYRRHLRKIAKGLEERPLLWVWGPPQTWLWEDLDRAGLVYELTDYIPGFGGKEHLVSEVERVMGMADVVFAVSRPLASWARRFNEQVFLVPNGVDPGVFARARSQEKTEVGFWGAVGPWVRTDLMEAVAEALPEVKMRIAGRVGPGQEEKMKRLLSRPNVSFLGEIDYTHLPDFLAPVGVGLVPFRTDPLGFATSPLKIYEAWAGGAGVVSTAIDQALELEEEGVLAVADEPASFAAAAARMLERRDPVRLARRAHECSWDARFERVLDAISRVFGP